jgi:hypothetical protein
LKINFASLVFLLRASAIRASSMALGLASVENELEVDIFVVINTFADVFEADTEMVGGLVHGLELAETFLLLLFDPGAHRQHLAQGLVDDADAAKLFDEFSGAQMSEALRDDLGELILIAA